MSLSLLGRLLFFEMKSHREIVKIVARRSSVAQHLERLLGAWPVTRRHAAHSAASMLARRGQASAANSSAKRYSGWRGVQLSETWRNRLN